jgi:scyllo-inositol 2-dehydrogenase (NADP+)
LSIAVGLVGFGFSARVLHLPLILSSGMSIVGVVTRQHAAVREALPSARVFADIESLLALERLDLVVIATPNHLHHAQGLAALEQGKHVVIDKPLALTTSEADSLIDAAARHGCKLAVFQNRRWDSDFLTIQRLVSQNLLGPLSAFEAHWDRYRPLVADRWREHIQYGGGLLYDLGAHLIDQALCLFGMPDWLQADVFAQREAALADDGFEIRMAKGNVRISLGAGSLVADHALRYRVHGLKASYRKSGLDVQERQLRAGMLPTDAAFGVEPPEQWGQLVQGETAGCESVVAECGRWREFYDSMRRSIEQDVAVPVCASEARRVLRIIEAARRSSDSGLRIAF